MEKYKKFYINGKYSNELKHQIIKDNSKSKLFTEGGRVYAIKNTIEEIYCIMNDLEEYPKCLCGNKLSLKRYAEGFREYCSTKCSNVEKARIQDKSIYLVKKKYFNKDEITKEILQTYINVNNIVDPNFYKMCNFKITSEDVYLIYNDIKNKPKCKMCTNDAIFIDFLKGYREHCSSECSNKNPERGQKIKESSLKVDENGLNAYQRMAKTSRITNLNTGRWLSYSEYSDFELYCRIVSRVQYKFKEEIKLLENYDLRGHANQGKYHLDHRYSKYQGFKDGIPPYIIGHICNLEMIQARNNLAKNRNCSLSKEELIEQFFTYEK